MTVSEQTLGLLLRDFSVPSGNRQVVSSDCCKRQANVHDPTYSSHGKSLLVKLIFKRRIGRLEVYGVGPWLLFVVGEVRSLESPKVLGGPNDVSASRFLRFSHTFRDSDPIKIPLDVQYVMTNT